MVHNPKNSQKAMVLCLEAAITLIYEATVKIGESLSKTKLFQQLCRLNGNSYDDSQRVAKIVYQLKRSGYVRIEGDSVRLTDKAKMRIVDKLAAEKGEEKGYFLVSFDIPETKSLERRQFRRAIKRMGFKQIQKSLWASNRQLGDLVEMASLEYKVNEFVAYFAASHSNIDHHIAKILHISNDNISSK